MAASLSQARGFSPLEIPWAAPSPGAIKSLGPKMCLHYVSQAPYPTSATLANNSRPITNTPTGPPSHPAHVREEEEEQTFQPHQLVVTFLAELQLLSVFSQQLQVGAAHFFNGLVNLGRKRSCIRGFCVPQPFPGPFGFLGR